MTMRKRLLLSASILVGLVCAVVFVLAMLPPRPGVTKANFDRIEKGIMTLEEVEAMFAAPGKKIARGKSSVMCEGAMWWEREDRAYAIVMFADSGTVEYKSWGDSDETVWRKIRRWLRL